MTNRTTYDKNTKTLMSVFALVFCMVGLAFASVPLYNMFCRVTGFGGTTQLSTAAPERILERTMTIRFNTDVNSKLPWSFKPEMHEITLNIGQDALINFIAQNNGDNAIEGTAIYNVRDLFLAF